MATPLDLDAAAAAVNAARSGAIAALIAEGRICADVRLRVPQHFAQWCAQLCQSPLAEAELLIRAAADRPEWISPEAVDLTDPLAAELEDLSWRMLCRRAGIPSDHFDQEVA